MGPILEIEEEELEDFGLYDGGLLPTADEI